MNQINNPSEPVPGATHVEAAGGNQNVDGTLSLQELNQMLGRQYTDVPTALAAIKETYGYVGKKVEPVVAANPAPVQQVQPTAPAQNFATADEVKQLKEDLFFSQNPQYKEHRALISKLGDNPSEVVGSAEFKPLFEKAQSADAANQGRSVVNSNARLAQPSAATDEAVKIANAPGVGAETLAGILAQGILEEYGVQ